ncbi:inositol monophosphatase [Ancylomarina euxinus]|uniref:Inositol-1-monophosphatase n=1 Tax=Ancylomarina euxinus TaxID=2283627 RepID=A0A425Y5L2_9BACT|nr:inositol monophosphatase family protein [Ancylomarina euxinus]MCZ4694350.1 inositol monophosphatase family protein [Ancylomarina euxinus]MUP14319.1 inositol monophosphatase [Ancylomarina euxinus]RRG23634.1 inositol monophosphatase [Ancylomarina euxinus]
MIDLESVCRQTQKIAIEVGSFIKEQQNKINANVIQNKGTHDFVTYVDKTSEAKIIEALKPLIPEAGFIAEEGTETTTGEKYNWIIDPLDGTTNYIHGFSPFAVSIALKKDDKIVLGLVYEISLNECFYSWDGAPAYLNNKVISVSEANTLETSLIGTGFPYHNFEQLDNYMELLKYLCINSQGVRRPGSAATDLAYVACGRFDAFYEYGLQSWDVAAGAFLVQQAGGKVCDFLGESDYIFGQEIIASNSLNFNEIKNCVQKFMLK